MAQAVPSQPQSRAYLPELDTNVGYAAIDLGSTSTRAYLTRVNKKTGQMSGFRVQGTGLDPYMIKRFMRGEWPSKGCPFDDPYPVGYDATKKEHADKSSRSLKSFVWFMADEDDDHPYTEDLIAYYNSLPKVQRAIFEKRLTEMIVRHLTIVMDQVLQEAALRGTTIQSLVCCVPNAWAKPNFQTILRPILDEVTGGIETFCVFESEALAQFILHQHPYLLVDYEFVLVCDFGGHFMGGSLFQFCRDTPGDDQPALVSLPQGNFGIRGGSELWEDHIRPHINEHLATLHLPADKESLFRARFLDAFFISKADVDASFYEKNINMRLVVSIRDVFDDDDELYCMYLQPADILQAWELGFRAAIDLVLGKIQERPESSRGRTVVILSGGSMLNQQAREEIQQACKGYRIDCQIMGFDLNPESSKWMVCEGAATAVACAMSPREFFKRGAALAVQSITRNGLHGTYAKVLFRGGQQATANSGGFHPPNQLERFEDNRGSPVEIELGSYTHHWLRIVCEPLYQRHRHRYPQDCISINSDDNNCYDVWDVSQYFEARADGTLRSMKIPPGRYLLQVEGILYHENGNDATLNLRMTRQVNAAAAPARSTRNLRPRTTSTAQHSYTFEVPLSSDGPSNLVLLDLDCVKNRLWKRQDVPTELPQAALEPESADKRLPASKRRRPVTPSSEEPENVGWDAPRSRRSAIAHQQGSEGVARASLETPIPTPSLSEPRNSITVTGPRLRTPRLGGWGGHPSIGGRRHLKPTARALRETPVRASNVDSAHGSADSGSDCSDIPESRVHFEPFPVRAAK